MRTRWWTAGLLILVLTGCGLVGGSQPVGTNLGAHAYIVDLEPQLTMASDVLVGDEIGEFVAVLAGYEELAPLADRVRQVDSETSVVVAVYYDACAKGVSALQLDGDRVLVDYVEDEPQRACVRAVDTLTVFAVPLSDLPDPVHFAMCGPDLITLRGGVKSGSFAYDLC